MERQIVEALERAGGILLSAMSTCPDQYRNELHEIAWRIGNLAAKIDPYQGDETDPDNPFGSALQEG